MDTQVDIINVGIGVQKLLDAPVRTMISNATGTPPGMIDLRFSNDPNHTGLVLFIISENELKVNENLKKWFSVFNRVVVNGSEFVT